MLKPTLQIQSSFNIDDSHTPRSPQSPGEKEALKDSLSDTNIKLNINSFVIESPAKVGKASLNFMDVPSPKTQPSRTSIAQNQPTMVLPDLRKKFMRKVLAILFLQLLITGFAIGLTFIKSIGVREFMATNLPVMIIMSVLSIGSLIVLTCNREACRKVPKNYILLFTYTISISYLLGGIAAMTESNIVLYAGAATALVVLGISLYACTAKKDLTRRGMGISTLMTMVIFLLIISLVFQARILQIIFSAAVALIFGLHLTFNIQKLTGKYEDQYSLDDYIIASLDMYVDIVQIFLALLEIFRRV